MRDVDFIAAIDAFIAAQGENKTIDPVVLVNTVITQLCTDEPVLAIKGPLHIQGAYDPDKMGMLFTTVRRIIFSMLMARVALACDFQLVNPEHTEVLALAVAVVDRITDDPEVSFDRKLVATNFVNAFMGQINCEATPLRTHLDEMARLVKFARDRLNKSWEPWETGFNLILSVGDTLFCEIEHTDNLFHWADALGFPYTTALHRNCYFFDDQKFFLDIETPVGLRPGAITIPKLS